MSNCVCIQRTVFKNYPNGDESYGYRMYDDHAQAYSNILSEKDMELPPEKFLGEIKQWFSQAENDMFDYALERGWIEIDGEDYELELNDNEWSLKKEV